MSTQDKEFKLCYVDGNWAFFTTQDLDKQWGDDWDDAPYEHNAGYPYEYNPIIDSDKEPWEIQKIAFDGDFRLPYEGFCNSPYSVQMINSKAVAWLVSGWYSKDKVVAILAGTSLEDFIKLVHVAGGNVYLELPKVES